MEAIIMLLVVVIGLVSLGGTSLRWGADSRDPLPDDHRR
jgi:nitrogen fixation-related uncharacterized protein